LLAPFAGCGSGLAYVEGEATFDGQPIENGMVSFSPADGNGPSAGGTIQKGRYAVSDVTPGPNLVQIEAVKDVPLARSSAEMAAMHEANKAKGNDSGLIDPADIVPPNAQGNNARHEIKPGSQTLDLHLKSPPR
jgi:hypothetical protein